ncbi:HET-domain-containing protein [Daldinia eschscholtzii]|nr:HET-domain-containing protein [Daldinia eschscholtzii]
MNPILPLTRLQEPFQFLLEDVSTQSLPDRLDWLHQVVPKDPSQPLREEFSQAFPDDVPDVLRLFLVDNHHQALLHNTSQCLVDNLRQDQADDPRQAVLRSLPQGIRDKWQQMVPKFKNGSSVLETETNEMWTTLQEVRDIVKALCEKDGYFSFIYSALEEFSIEHHVPSHSRGSLQSPLSTARNGSERDLSRLGEATRLPVNISQGASPQKGDPTETLDFGSVLLEIIDSAIFEILNVFNIDMAPEQVPTKACPITHLELLRDLYETSRSLRPTKRASAQSDKFKLLKSSYQYSRALDPSTSDIRVLEIHSGIGEDPIECHFTVCNLHSGIPEALSYVWGESEPTQSILVDQEPFPITKNLYRILQALRRPNATRAIWVDAICINQSDDREKTHQVRLMRDIYSKAESTIIWLSENKTSQKSTEDGGQHIPFKMGKELNIDENNLATILEECLKHSMNSLWTEKQWAIYIMLFHCVRQIHSNSWWERIWTIQEGALPVRAPTILFRGHSFSFDDLIAAEDLIIKIGSSAKLLQTQIINLYNVLGPGVQHALFDIAASSMGTVCQTPLLLMYRRGIKQDKNSKIFLTFTCVLFLTDFYKATDPRDKIFALESLLSRSIGRLIHVDYNEDCNEVFKRATARSFNSVAQLYLVGSFKFLCEASLLKDQEPTGPSWVLDFAYSNASYYNCNSARRATDKVTLDGYLAQNKFPRTELETTNTTCFATPTTLFCTGYCVDQICGVGEIPSVNKHDPVKHMVSFILSVYLTRQSILGLAVPSDYIDRLTRGDSEVALEFRTWLDLFTLQEEERRVK